MWSFEIVSFTHCWTIRACGILKGDLLLDCFSIVFCSRSLNAVMSSGIRSRKIPRPWLRPVGLQIHIPDLSLHIPKGHINFTLIRLSLMMKYLRYGFNSISLSTVSVCIYITCSLAFKVSLSLILHIHTESDRKKVLQLHSPATFFECGCSS